MRNFSRLMYVSTIAIGLYATAASAQTLGASRSSIKRLYPDAALARLAGAPALELKDVDYAGVRWTKVDYVFDAAGRLSRLSMSTTASDYGTVLKLAQLQLNPPGAKDGVSLASEDPAHDMEIRVCETSSGQVVMTFEPVSTVS